MVVKSKYAAAIPLFQQAISLDPNFAMAYARMGTSYSDLNETVRSAECVSKAYGLRERVSQREKFYIASHYEMFVTGNLEAARKVYELSAQTYPRDTRLGNLGFLYSQLGEYEKALAEYKEDLKLNSEQADAYADLASAYLQLNKLDEAQATARQALGHDMDVPEIHLNLYWVDFLRHDVGGMEREAAGLMGKPGDEDQMLNYESDTALYGGQLTKARVLTRRAIESARKADEKEAAALYEADAAVREALVGNPDFAKQQAQAALLSNGRDGGFVGHCAGTGGRFLSLHPTRRRFGKALPGRYDCAIPLFAYHPCSRFASEWQCQQSHRDSGHRRSPRTRN
jgi:tetratricopeptide (TPR) repeat protein